jgi:hypothetical protein
MYGDLNDAGILMEDNSANSTLALGASKEIIYDGLPNKGKSPKNMTITQVFKI